MRCDECGWEADAGAGETGWLAFRIDLPDDPDEPEISVYCPHCAAREYLKASTSTLDVDFERMIPPQRAHLGLHCRLDARLGPMLGTPRAREGRQASPSCP